MRSMRANDRALTRSDKFALLSASYKLGAVLARMRCKLIVHLDVIKARIMGNFAYRLQMMITDRLSMEVNRARGRLLDLGTATNFVKHR